MAYNRYIYTFSIVFIIASVRSRLTLKNKIDVIKCNDAKIQIVPELATRFKVEKTQIETILKSLIDLFVSGVMQRKNK
jgi:hypothetical protein